ncbi:hypothetical protein ATHL_01198 [Anaerolinea thermolimosa]|uniref:hypothetical protein n=1 Tax=Anaerolinea thermolimosa TaxID=229919 RepID=UPI000780BBC4|nr:hypothetical protein [Anaerolinea thermolimosa]GAP06344.1 hypothetical protein ATHL_01198 [Anaerolinea thermolimosa]
MKMSFESDLLVPSISQFISILTDRAKVCVKDIRYDKPIGIVEVSMQRRELTGFKKSLLGEGQPVYSQKMIKSLLKIRNVEEMKLEINDRLATDCNSCFTVMLGLKIDNNQLYLGSVEEIQGNILCQIIIRVKKIDIEFCDEIDSVSREHLMSLSK